MKAKLFSLLLGVALAITLLIGCGSAQESNGGQNENKENVNQGEQKKEKYKIGFSQATLASPFYTEMKAVAEAYAKEKILN